MSLAKISKISLWMIIPLGLVGSLLHFSYEWSGKHPIVAIFSAVNDSYWEHIKIAFWPVLVLQLVFFISGGFRIRSYFSAMAVSLYLIPITMIAEPDIFIDPTTGRYGIN
jgi:hypothetical protein